jgi:hypothetical protein
VGYLEKLFSLLTHHIIIAEPLPLAYELRYARETIKGGVLGEGVANPQLAVRDPE